MRMLLLGGARSGKSSLAARWAAERARNVCFVATAVAADPEMAGRIAAHRQSRPSHWRVREESLRLGPALAEEAERVGPEGLVLVDCLTLWIANCLWRDGDGRLNEAGWRCERTAFLEALEACHTDVILVSNEVGAGVVPDNVAARLFRDEQGWLNQAVAAVCEEVHLVVAALPLRLKPA